MPVATGAAFGAEVVPGADELRNRFYEVHESSYGYYSDQDPIEAINFRLTARGKLYRDSAQDGEAASGPPGEAASRRPVFFTAEEAVETPVYLRADLKPGQVLEGPAILDQLDTTIPIFPGDRALVHASGSLIIELAP